MPDIIIEQVSNMDDLWMLTDKLALYTLYDECFGDEVFDRVYGGEKFEPEEVVSFFEMYTKKGILIFSQNKETSEIIGFVAAIPLILKTDVWDIAYSHLEYPSDYWYYADLGVSSRHRRKGLAQKLASILLETLPTSFFIMRVRKDNTASIVLHKNLGFKILKDAQGHEICQNVSIMRKTGTVEADERIFFTIRK